MSFCTAQRRFKKLQPRVILGAVWFGSLQLKIGFERCGIEESTRESLCEDFAVEFVSVIQLSSWAEIRMLAESSLEANL